MKSAKFHNFSLNLIPNGNNLPHKVSLLHLLFGNPLLPLCADIICTCPLCEIIHKHTEQQNWLKVSNFLQIAGNGPCMWTHLRLYLYQHTLYMYCSSQKCAVTVQRKIKSDGNWTEQLPQDLCLLLCLEFPAPSLLDLRASLNSNRCCCGLTFRQSFVIWPRKRRGENERRGECLFAHMDADGLLQLWQRKYSLVHLIAACSLAHTLSTTCYRHPLHENSI